MLLQLKTMLIDALKGQQRRGMGKTLNYVINVGGSGSGGGGGERFMFRTSTWVLHYCGNECPGHMSMSTSHSVYLTARASGANFSDARAVLFGRPTLSFAQGMNIRSYRHS